MVSLLFKWFMIAGMFMSNSATPDRFVFVSVTEIEHNAKDKTLEISCRIFTEDFEKTLRQTYKGTVDLLHPKNKKDKAAMSRLVSGYVKKHLLVKVEGKPVALQFIGYEQQEEGVMSYYEVHHITSVKKIAVVDNLLFEYKKEQMSIIHVTVDGERKTARLINPEDKASFEF